MKIGSKMQCCRETDQSSHFHLVLPYNIKLNYLQMMLSIIFIVLFHIGNRNKYCHSESKQQDSDDQEIEVEIKFFYCILK